MYNDITKCQQLNAFNDPYSITVKNAYNNIDRSFK